MLANLADNSRAAWVNPARWVHSPAASISALRYIVLHVPGVDTEQPTTRPGIIDRLRNQHERDRSNLPGNFKYSFVADLLGETWEGRGLLLRNAANGSKVGTAADKIGVNWNLHSVSIQLMLRNGQTPPAAMISAVRSLIGRINLAVGRPLVVVGHSAGRGLGYDSTATACPGPIVSALIAGGRFATNPPPLPPVEPGPSAHTVAGGDTWYGIARRYRIPLGDLLIANAPTIRPGEIVKLPDTAQ